MTKEAKVLIACEESGVIRSAFEAKGFAALSCDIRPTVIPGPHYQGDVRDLLGEHWDLIIAHPPCEDLTTAGNKFYAEKRKSGKFQVAKEFYELFTKVDSPRVCIENPKGWLNTIQYDGFMLQMIQPYWFGHPVKKQTWLRLKGLPPLRKTKVIALEYVWDEFKDLGKKDRARIRSKTFKGVANAMADQWGSLL